MAAPPPSPEPAHAAADGAGTSAAVAAAAPPPIGSLSMREKDERLAELVRDGWLAHVGARAGAYCLGVSAGGCWRNACLEAGGGRWQAPPAAVVQQPLTLPSPCAFPAPLILGAPQLYIRAGAAGADAQCAGAAGRAGNLTGRGAGHGQRALVPRLRASRALLLLFHNETAACLQLKLLQKMQGGGGHDATALRNLRSQIMQLEVLRSMKAWNTKTGCL